MWSPLFWYQGGIRSWGQVAQTQCVQWCGKKVGVIQGGHEAVTSWALLWPQPRGHREVHMFIVQLKALRGVEEVSWVLHLRCRTDKRRKVCLTSPDSIGNSPLWEKQQYFAYKPALSWFKPGFKTCAHGRGGPSSWRSSQGQDFAYLPVCRHLWIWAK